MPLRSSAARTLASESRLQILHLLQSRERPVGAEEIAEAVDLHINTVREHLDRLIAGGFVARESEQRTTRGRPRRLYTVVDRPAGASMDPRVREQLGKVLLEGAANDGAPDDAARHQIVALEQHFEDLGFEPDADRDALQVHLHRCPVAALASRSTSMVCSVHLALVRGVLNRQGGPVVAERLEPFVGPSHCVLHLRDTSEPC